MFSQFDDRISLQLLQGGYDLHYPSLVEARHREALDVGGEAAGHNIFRHWCLEPAVTDKERDGMKQ